MAKEKTPSNASTPKKKPAAKKSAAKKAPANKPVAGEIVAAAAVASPAPTSSERTAQPSAARLHEEIRQRAYQFFRERGGQHGSHEADWHRAESEVRSKYRT